MSQVYPERLTIAKRPAQDFAAELDRVIRRKIGELIQAALDAEVRLRLPDSGIGLSALVGIPFDCVQFRV